ncbi:MULTISPECIES: bZIP transcription factor [Anoxybacillaceae]|uniref:Uncharacterized protein n=2 Tax=Anoxybacillaceae TaxID=3120669 RepID=A0A150KW60_9BACL|nr:MULTISPECIES: bZIP transcription factor [Parageobacillus]KYD04278.1 hypothetical protein B4119_3350 [Parageobacillus caldoxylosilyticus]SFA56132.1 hypothetical protein SAMN05192569_106911 [Parageobacillus thermantarcticus]
MLIVIGFFAGLALIIYSIIHHFRHRKKEGYRKANFFIPLVSGILLFGISLSNASVATSKDELEKKLEQVTDERDDLSLEVTNLQAELDKVKAEARTVQKSSDADGQQQNTSKEETKQETEKTVTLGTGTFYVGEDIKAGRYIVSTKGQSGNFVVLNELGVPEVNEILGTDSMAVNNITVSLKEGQEIRIMSLNQVTFTPKK